MWTYTHEGAVIEWEGTWNAEKQAFTWNAPIAGELKGTLTIGCADKDKLDRDFKIKVGFITGYSATGTLTRKK